MISPGDSSDRSTEPVAITGIGVMLPGASTVQSFWDNLHTGSSQLRLISRFEPAAEGLDVHVGAELGSFDVREALPNLTERHAANYDREILAAIASIASAWRDSGLHDTGVDPRRLSIIESSSRGSIAWWLSDESRAADAFSGASAMLCGLPASAASLAAIYLGARGFVTTISAACVGGHHAIGLALRELRSGDSDAVLVGGYDFPLVPNVLRAFQAMGTGVLSSERDRPSRAVRPYSRDRDGMVLGEGAITLCLEPASTARARGARQYAHILEHRGINEADHATRMDLTGKVTAELVTEVLNRAGRSVDEVGYFCGHGTATRANDVAESRALQVLYPNRPLDELPPIGSNKPIYGHLLGAAGIVNVASTALMLYHRSLVPTINLVDVDPECAQDHVADGPRSVMFDLAVSLTFAIGSQSSAVALGAAA